MWCLSEHTAGAGLLEKSQMSYLVQRHQMQKWFALAPLMPFIRARAFQSDEIILKFI